MKSDLIFEEFDEIFSILAKKIDFFFCNLYKLKIESKQKILQIYSDIEIEFYQNIKLFFRIILCYSFDTSIFIFRIKIKIIRTNS